MKKRIKILLVTMMTILISGSSFAQEKKDIDLTLSTAKWVGNGYYGTIKLKKGELRFNEALFKEGKLTLDMTSITVDNPEIGQKKEPLEQYLKSNDYWDTKNHGTLQMVITDVVKTDNTTYTATGTMTIKGIAYTIPLSLNFRVRNAITVLKMDLTNIGINPKPGSIYARNENQPISTRFSLIISVNY